MFAVDDTRDARAPTGKTPMRRCAVTRERAPKDSLLRLCLDPAGAPVFDVMARAPGRGVYVSPDRETVQQALSSAGWGRIFRGAGKAPAPDRVEGILEQTAERLAGRVRDHLTFARRAGVLVWGVTEVLDAQTELSLVVVAEDLSARSRELLRNATGKWQCLYFGRKAVLGECLGKTEVGAVGLRPSIFVERIERDVERHRRLTNQRPGPEWA